MNRRAPIYVLMVLQVLAVIAFALGLHGMPAAEAAPPIDPPSRIAAIHNTAATANTGVVSGGWTLEAAYPVEATRVTVAISSTSTTLDLTVSDGNTTESLTLNSGTALATGKLYTFSFGTARLDESGDTLTYNLDFEASTTVDYLVVERARVGSP